MMLRTGIVYPLLGTRHVLPYWVFLELLTVCMFDQWLNERHKLQAKVLALAACAYVLTPIAYDWYGFLRFEVFRRISQSYTSSANQLFVQTLSQSNVVRIEKLVSSNLRGPQDVVVMATTNLGMESWLEIPQRMLPLSTFWHPIARKYGTEGANIWGRSPILSSRNLRVILVLSNLYSEPRREEMLKTIMGRFPQAHRWIAVEDRSLEINDASLWYADLDASVTTLVEPRQ